MTPPRFRPRPATFQPPWSSRGKFPLVKGTGTCPCGSPFKKAVAAEQPQEGV